MMNQKRLRLTQIALSLSIALASVPALAQNTTSAIGGRISASDGKPASGATVHILHVESGSVSTVTTDAEGRYVARGLRAGGPYTITITKNGVSEKRDNIFVEVAETAAVDATIGQAMQTVTIAGSSAARAEKFSKTNMGSVTSISSAELAIQGSINRNLQDYARTDPRVSQTDKERGEMSVAGQNSRFNSMTIDGVAVNDTFGLEASGSPLSKQPISIEAIQSVQVNVANYDVTQKGYTGGNINAVTKSGTNTVKGSVYYVFRNDKLAGDRFNSSNGTYFEPAPFKETTKGLTLGGPLIKDKLFLFANYEKWESSRSAPAFGPLGSSMTNVGITPEAIARAQDISKSVYGFDAGTSQVPEGLALDVTDKLLKLDWNINDDHRFMLRWSKTEESNPIFPGMSNTGLSLNSYWYSQIKALETKVAQLNSDWSPTFSTELKFSTRDYDSVPEVNSQLPSVGLNFTGPNPAGTPSSVSTGSRFLNMGTENSRQRNLLGTKTVDAYLGANWELGAHQLKFGADLNKNDVTNVFLQNVYGSYTFGCLNNVAYTSLGGATIDCGRATQAQIQSAILENYTNGRPSSYTLQVPAAGRTFDDAIARFTLKNYGIFLQDTWSVTDRLTLSGGVRIDYIDLPESPVQNATVALATVAGNPATGARQTGGFGLDNTHTIDGQKLFQPRVGFNYKLDSQRATQIRGGAGLFQGAAMSVWLANPYQNNGVATRTISCGSSTAPCPTGMMTADITKQPSNLAGSQPAAAVDALAKGLRQPSTWKANVAFEHELPWYGAVLGAELLMLKTKDGIYYENLNLGAPTRKGTDGRDLFYTTQAYKPECWTATGSLTTTNSSSPTGPQCAGARNKSLSNASFTNVLVAKNTDGGDSKLFTLSLSRPLMAGFGWSVAYTYTDSKEVSPLTSSTSSSNYGSRPIFHPNEEVESNSSYMVKDRFNAMVNFRKAFFGNYNTTFGLFYEGRTGKPFSWTFNNDMNGDGIGSNDLMYIPKAPGSGEVIFAGDTATNHANEDRFWATVEQYRSLRNAKGGIVKRNDSFAPWTHTIDMRVKQEIPSFIKGHKASLTFDIFNFGNLLNKKWGRTNEVGFASSGGHARSFVDFGGIDPATGKYVYRVRDRVEDYEVKQGKGESQWAIQATLKYEF
jgi:outer membrane receptor protein involved in Fe transport